ncbi:SDR family oxidoreductase [Amycolatopsis lurida]
MDSEHNNGTAGREPFPLRGRAGLVTGVSRRQGIGYAIARRLASCGASLMLHHYQPHDADQPWGADDLGAVLSGVRAQLTGPDARVDDISMDLNDPDAPRRLVEKAVNGFGHLDFLVCNHARSGSDGGCRVRPLTRRRKEHSPRSPPPWPTSWPTTGFA